MLIKKPPIVTILGHVDHGKTTLLQYLLRTYLGLRVNLTEKEAGGITQKVRAFEVIYQDEKITFIDTPGHEAFTTLRDRGAAIADLAILIIAAEEGVKPQTKESLDILTAAKVPFIIALNKIDKPQASADKVKQQLVELGVAVEGGGGEIPVVEISALQGQGVAELLELVSLMAELKELKFEPDREAEGYVLEAIKHPQKGILVNLVIQNGTLRNNDFVITASTSGKLRFIEDVFGNRKESASACAPVMASGFETLPLAGEQFKVTTALALKQIQQDLQAREILFKQKILVSAGEPTGDLNLIIKADHLGTLEALENILKQAGEENKINLTIIRANLGPVTPEDVRLAKNTGATILSFGVKNLKEITENIKHQRLRLIESNVIYELKEQLEELLREKEKFGEVKGELEILAVFNKTASKKTVGGEVKHGLLRPHNKVIMIRAENPVGRGKILSLEQNKETVEKVEAGNLCGLVIETQTEIEAGDRIVVQ